MALTPTRDNHLVAENTKMAVLKMLELVAYELLVASFNYDSYELCHFLNMVVFGR